MRQPRTIRSHESCRRGRYRRGNHHRQRSVSNLDFLSLRARAGWALGNFLPYGFVGFALGRADIAIAANVSVLQCPSGGGVCAPFSFAGSAGKSGDLLYGLAVGGGMDIALTPNIFVRGEYEYTRFAPIANVLLTVTSAASAPASNSDARRTIVCTDQARTDHMRLIFIATEASGRTSRLATMSLVAVAYFLKCSVSRCACAEAASS
jgi:opacity protein-like surface antigen